MTEAVSQNLEGELMPTQDDVSISDDGTRIVFHTNRDNFLDNPFQNIEVFARDLVTQTTSIVSVLPDGGLIVGGGDAGVISGNGRYVVFLSDGENLPVSDGHNHVWRRDLDAGVTELVSQAGETPANRASDDPEISDDGTRVAFLSSAFNLVPGADTIERRAYLVDLEDDSIQLLAVNNAEEPAQSIVSELELSGDGRFAIFRTSWPLVDGAPTDSLIYLRDTELKTTVIASVDENGDPVVSLRADISDDGRYVAFMTPDRAAASDTNDILDIYVFDRTTGTSRRVSFNYEQVDLAGPSSKPIISGDGTVVGFATSAANAVPEKTSIYSDAYVIDLDDI